MGLQGDLATLDITNLLQNLEGARKSGLLAVRDEREETQLFFADGRLSLIAYPSRASLIEFLAAAGAIDAGAIETAKKRRKRGHPLSSALVETGVLTAEQLRAIASARLVDEACEVLAARATQFEFSETGAPSELFDPDERALALSLAASPLLLESARRSDHWAMIREHLPSDSAHFHVVKPPRAPGEPEQARFLAQILALVDGSRSVREIVAHFPTRRFDVYQRLAELSRTQSIRPIATSDLNQRVLELARRDRKGALALLERGLEQNPHHLALLCTKALLAEKAGDLEQASEALKLVVHLQLENSEREPARATLERLKKLDQSDPFAWEKSFELALAEKRRKDAVADARKLIELHRKPGLHRKVAQVLERLIALQGSSWKLVQELARARAEAGDRDAAVKGLEQFAADSIDLESYPLACKAYEEVLLIQPARTKAKEKLQELRSGALLQRKQRRRRMRRRLLALFTLLVVLPWCTAELLARRAYVSTTRSIVHDQLLESGDYDGALARYAAVRSRYAWTLTGHFDLDPLIEELTMRARKTTK